METFEEIQVYFFPKIFFLDIYIFKLTILSYYIIFIILFILKVLWGHTDKVHAVEFSNKDDFVVSGGEDWNIKIWCMNLFICKRTLLGHKDAICSV